MKKFAILAAAAAFLAPAMISAASAETASVNVRVGSPGYHSRAEGVVIRSHKPHCRTVVTHIRRDNGVRITKKVRKCD